MEDCKKDRVFCLFFNFCVSVWSLQIKLVVLVELLISNLPASEQFKYKNSQGPAVGSKVMAFVHDHLWGQVLWGSTESPGLLSQTNLFSKAKVCLRVWIEISGKRHIYTR